MKMFNVDDHVNVLDDSTNIDKAIKSICNSGQQEDAFYILDIGDLVNKHEKWIRSMPRVKPFYAVKCNDSLPVLQILSYLGVNFDCASKEEINEVLEIGVDPKRIIFANPVKAPSYIKFANEKGVDTMTFDNEEELYKIKDLYPNAKMVLRFKCDGEVIGSALGKKFGCDPKHAPYLLRVAKSLEINVIGVCFHVGSGCKTPQIYRKAIKHAREIFDAAYNLGYNLHLLDIGGGFPGDKSDYFNQFADVINLSIQDFFPETTIDIIAEPGRYYVTSAFTLVVNVHSKRTIMKHDEKMGTIKHHMYYINDGVFGGFNGVLFNEPPPPPKILTTRATSTTNLYSSSIWGPTCDSFDLIMSDTLLPELHLGDWLVFDNMGAYTLTLVCNFNGFPTPEIKCVSDENVWQLVKDQLPLIEDHITCKDENVKEKIFLDYWRQSMMA